MKIWTLTTDPLGREQEQAQVLDSHTSLGDAYRGASDRERERFQDHVVTLEWVGEMDAQGRETWVAEAVDGSFTYQVSERELHGA